MPNDPHTQPDIPFSPQPAAPSLDQKKIGISPLPFFILGIVGFVLAAAAFAFFSKGVFSRTRPTTPPANSSAVVPKAVPSTPSPAPVVVAQPPAGPQEEKIMPTLTLSGILESKDGSLALINGKIIPEGGVIEGVKVEKILSDAVVLNFEEKKVILRSR